jgi:hypothetical protein
VANEIIIDLENRLKSYMPSIFELLEGHNLSRKQWKKLNKNFINKFNERKKSYTANNDYLLVEANMFDIISGAIDRNESALRLLGFFNVLFERLSKNLSKDEKSKIRDTIFNILVNLDHKYRNFIGELAVLNSLLENTTQTLIGVESDIISKKNTADYTIGKRGNSEIELVEIVNIHIDEADINLNEILTQKITNKLNEKTNCDANHEVFTLVPVIWAPVVDLQRVESLYKSGERIDIPNVSEPFAYCCFYTPANLPIYRFCRITTLFTKNEIEVIIA